VRAGLVTVAAKTRR